MKYETTLPAEIGPPDAFASSPALDLVVPFIDRDLTEAAISAAGRLSEGLRAEVRLVLVQPVPYPCDLDHPPVPVDFLHKQLAEFRSPLPVYEEVRLARNFTEGLTGALRPASVVVLASKRRWWPTRTARLAAALKRRGHRAVLVFEGEN